MEVRQQPNDEIIICGLSNNRAPPTQAIVPVPMIMIELVEDVVVEAPTQGLAATHPTATRETSHVK